MWKHSQSFCVIRNVLQNIHKPLGSASLSNTLCPHPPAALVVLGLWKSSSSNHPYNFSTLIQYDGGIFSWLACLIIASNVLLTADVAILCTVHRDTITLGLDLFSGEYLNMLLFQWYPLIENNSIYGVHQVRCFFVLKQKQRQFTKHCVSLKNLMTDKVPKNKIVSVNFSRAMFSLLDFLTLEDGSDRVSQNFGKELPLYAV